MPHLTGSTARRTLSVIGLSLALPSIAWAPSMERLTLQPESRLWVEGGSTLRNWSCKAEDFQASIDAAPNGISQVVAGEKGIRTVSVTVTAAKIECGNGTMNEHMRKALKVVENPTIGFHLAGYDVARSATGAAGTLKGTLTLGGVQKPITIPAEGKLEGGVLHITGAYELNMSDYDLKAPTLMFGRIKVRDAVNVKFDLLLTS